MPLGFYRAIVWMMVGGMLTLGGLASVYNELTPIFTNKCYALQDGTHIQIKVWYRESKGEPFVEAEYNHYTGMREKGAKEVSCK